MGTFFNTFTSSDEGLVTPTPTRQPAPETFASVIPTFAFVFNLKVFAIFCNYPSAIASAVASPCDAGGAPAIFSVPVILALP